MTTLKYQIVHNVVGRRIAIGAVIFGLMFLSWAAVGAAKPPGNDDGQSPGGRQGRSSATEDRSNAARQRQPDPPPRRESSRDYSAPPQPTPAPRVERRWTPPSLPTPAPKMESRWTPPTLPPSVTSRQPTAPREVVPRGVEARRLFSDRADSLPNTKSNTSDTQQAEQLRRQTDWLRKQALGPRPAPPPLPSLPTLPKRPEADSLRGRVPAAVDTHAPPPQRIVTPDPPQARKPEMITKGAKDVPPAPRIDRTNQPERKLPAGYMKLPSGQAKHPSESMTTNLRVLAPPHMEIRDVSRMRFSEELKSGRLDRLTSGEVAQKIKLADQFRLAQQGDVARRLELHKQFDHVGHVPNITRVTNVIDAPKVTGVHRDFIGAAPIYGHNLFHGRIGPHYTRDCLELHYWGPHHFSGLCWYPRWHPWVQWSWHHHCHPYWDPRPIWCRPVIYEPCPTWVWWEPPVWQPLPVVACGTWVDVPPVAVAQPYDLQLLAVRFVDPGHPEQNLGPRYRVWYRNNSGRPLVQPFNVMLFAGNGDRMAAELPQAGVRVTAIEAGDVQSVDVRLPVEVYAMGRDAAGNAVPFNVLHVLLDASREIPEVTRTNNGAHLARDEVLPVDPAAFEASPQETAGGGEIMLAGEGFGPRPGQVLVHMAGLELEGEVLGWYDLGVRVTLPKVSVAGATEAELIVVRGDGAAANPLKIRITPPGLAVE